MNNRDTEKYFDLRLTMLENTDVRNYRYFINTKTKKRNKKLYIKAFKMVTANIDSKSEFRISLDKNYYINLPEYYNPHNVRVEHINLALIFLEKKGLIGINKGKYSSNEEYIKRTVVYALNQKTLKELIKSLSEAILGDTPNIKVKKLKKATLKKGRTYIINRDSENNLIKVKMQNKAIKLLKNKKTAVVKSNNSNIDTELTRVFRNGKGGRFYGAYQNLNKADRSRITINGVDTVELDFKTMHPRLIYKELNIKMPTKPYQVEGFVRSLGKTAFNIMLNTTSKKIALYAIRKATGLNLKDSNTLVNRIIKKHSSVPFFQSKGLDLQLIDSEICLNIMIKFNELDKVILPVHDSFIVKAEDKELLRSVMKEEINREHI
jgi:hypothetical protein